MRITVDGKPIDDPNRSSSDVQRCTDVALDDAKIQFRFDNLESRPRLGVAAHPNAVAIDGPRRRSGRRRPCASACTRTTRAFIERAEVRVFGREQSLRAEPLAVAAGRRRGARGVATDGRSSSPIPSHELQFVLRAYDAKGNFDETEPQPLWINHEPGG